MGSERTNSTCHFCSSEKTERKEQKALSKINLICFLVKTIFRRGMASGFPLVSLKPKTILYVLERNFATLKAWLIVAEHIGIVTLNQRCPTHSPLVALGIKYPCKSGVHNSFLMAGQKKILAIPKGPNVMF